MKTTDHPNNHSRCWTVAELPQEHPQDLAELEIYVQYTGDGDVAKGVAIDSYVVPLLKLAPRLLEVVQGYTGLGLATLHLTKEELAEVKRLSGVGLSHQPHGADEPDCSDGCDREGFAGGCERAGHTVETCGSETPEGTIES